MSLGLERPATPATVRAPSFGHTPRSSSPVVDGAAMRRKRTRAIGVGASLVLHGVVLTWLGLHAAPALHSTTTEDTPLIVELVRPRLLQPATAAPSAPAARPSAAIHEGVVLPRPRPAAAPPLALAPRPLPLPPAAGGGRSVAAGGASAIGAQPAPGPLPGQEMQGDLRGFLRGTVGCSHEEYLRLTPAERGRCDTGFATAARTAPPIPLPDDKLAGYARQAEANERRRTRREGSLEQPFTGCEIGSAAASKGLGCLPPGAIHSVAKF